MAEVVLFVSVVAGNRARDRGRFNWGKGGRSGLSGGRGDDPLFWRIGVGICSARIQSLDLDMDCRWIEKMRLEPKLTCVLFSGEDGKFHACIVQKPLRLSLFVIFVFVCIGCWRRLLIH